MGAKFHRDVREPHRPRREPGGPARACSPVFPFTIGLILLIPALVSVGPVSAALLLRYRNAEVAAGTALLAATVVTVGVLFGAASVAFVSAWRRSRLRDVRQTYPDGTAVPRNGIRLDRRRTI